MTTIDRHRGTATHAQPSWVPDGAPTFRTVAHYPTYVAAEQATEHLHELGVSDEDVTIVGRGLNPVPATGRLVAWGASGRTAALGAAIGALLGAFLGLTDALPPTAAYVILSGAAIGGAIGAVVGYVRHRVRTTGNDLAHAVGLRADAYQIQVDADHVDPKRAEHRLAKYWPM
ncbi:hypothetical protein SAMN05421812_12371 [Asanoa hainanensis]|uniref:Uncharacterized protein n=1 Tax=Asanoa hainanensis TaxID=560556 RepID=A0A239PFV4_9ACTN|nr:hypothetical protein [Asanoa hainanensis]SNT65518.1 hypothetical protein SAMN05421812_12371 [Asanoa hainanensis]